MLYRYMQLLLATQKVAQGRGHSFNIVEVNAGEMLDIAWALLEKAYYVRMRRRGCNLRKVEKAARFNKDKVFPRPEFPAFTKDNHAITYIVGWTLVPNYMKTLRQHMHPVCLWRLGPLTSGSCPPP